MAASGPQVRRFDPVYHFVLGPTVLGLAVLGAYLMVDKLLNGQWAEGLFFLLLAVANILFYALVRQYPLATQGRLIRQELRLRYHALTGEHFIQRESQLNLGQIMVLSLAGDDELLELIDKTVDEDLTPEEILRRIKHRHVDPLRL